ncbi:MAG: nitronate monooxygenase [Deltaproteobacteria bacterium]|nr:nitronate monooxygenase [Deltaproteobacteria bacterium]MBW2418357.1 nitronate monooxygenase [Deltaproteobacteria bacterium]
MRTALCETLGIEYPIFAFSHCRDVVAAVSRAGGFGVLGAVTFSADQLESELQWLDEHVGEHGYGVDTVIPARYEGKGEEDPEKLEAQLLAAVPQRHRDFAKQLLADSGVPELPEGQKPRATIGWSEAAAGPQVEVALAHDRMKLLANALGTPPAEMVSKVQASGRLVAALCGSPAQALKHKAAGVDIIIAQGQEAGGHTGDIGSIVLWPQVVDAVAPTPVLAAGGIGSGRQIVAALAQGTQGVWMGSVWLTVSEADAALPEVESYLAASSRDTVRSRSFTGKLARMLRNDWTDAWEAPDAPDPLPMPLQGMISLEAVDRAKRHPGQGQQVAFNAVGQIVGSMNQVQPVRQVMSRLVDEYLEAFDELEKLMPGGQ